MQNEDLITLKLRALGLGAGASQQGSGGCPGDEVFAAFYDGTLDEKDASPIRSHLAECPACHKAYRALKETETGDAPPLPGHLIAAAWKLAPVAEEKAASEPAGRIALRLLASALQVLNLENIRITRGLEPALEPVRSGKESAATEILEMTPPLPGIERITLQKIEPDDVRISVRPSGEVLSQRGAMFRIDLFKDDALVQSWPLEESVLPLEPVTHGLYRLDVIRVEASPGTRPETIGSIAIALES